MLDGFATAKRTAPDDQGLNEFVHEMQAVAIATDCTVQIAKFRGSQTMRGRHAFEITNDGLVVYPRIKMLLSKPSRPDESGAERVSSGVGQFDAMLGGGHPAASTTMLMGPSGVGKTTLGLQFLSQCSDAEGADRGQGQRSLPAAAWVAR